MERSLDFTWTPFASTTCGGFHRAFAATRTPVLAFGWFRTRSGSRRDRMQRTANRFAAVQLSAAIRCTTIALETGLVAVASQAPVSGA
jgi:hypothetical protein